MDDDVEPRDTWVVSRLKAAARDAYAAPRRRLLLPAAASPRRASVGWLRGHRLVLALVALNAATGAAVIALGLSLTLRGGPATAPAVSATSAGPPPGAVAGSVALGFTLRGGPLGETPPVVAFGSVWLTDTDAGTIVRIDTRSLRVTAVIFVDTGGGPTGLATDGATLWATVRSRGGVVRIDPASNRVVDTIEVGGVPSAVAVSGGTLWVTVPGGLNDRGTLAEIDVSAHRVVRTFATGSGPGQVVVTPTMVWVDNGADGTLSRLDLASGQMTTTRGNAQDYDFGDVSVAADATGAWAVDNNRAVLEHYDGAFPAAGDAIGLGIGAGRGGNGPVGVALDGQVAWVVTTTQLDRVDLRTGSVLTMSLAGGHAVATGDGAVWVIAGDRTHARLLKIVPAR